MVLLPSCLATAGKWSKATARLESVRAARGGNARAAASALAALQALDKACSKSRHPAAG